MHNNTVFSISKPSLTTTTTTTTTTITDTCVYLQNNPNSQRSSLEYTMLKTLLIHHDSTRIHVTAATVENFKLL